MLKQTHLSFLKWVAVYLCGVGVYLLLSQFRSPELYAAWQWVWAPSGILFFAVGAWLSGGWKSCFAPLSQSKTWLGLLGTVMLLALVALPAFAMPLEAAAVLLAGLGGSLRGEVWITLWNADVIRWMLICVVSYAWFGALVRWNGAKEAAT